VTSPTSPPAPLTVSADQRRAARLAAVQALYQVDVSTSPVNQVVAEFLRHRLTGPDAAEVGGRDSPPTVDRDFFAATVEGAARAHDQLDAALDLCIDKGWRMARLDRVLQALLRAAAWELTERDDIPQPVTIAEYVAIADSFFNGPEPALANAVLDRLARTLRASSPEATAADEAAVAPKSEPHG